MRPTADSDWLDPETVAQADTERPVFAGVWRVEAHGECGSEYPTLISALVEPPMSPEASLLGAAGCLAECHPDEARWVLTSLGCERVAREANGVAA